MDQINPSSAHKFIAAVGQVGQASQNNGKIHFNLIRNCTNSEYINIQMSAVIISNYVFHTHVKSHTVRMDIFLAV